MLVLLFEQALEVLDLPRLLLDLIGLIVDLLVQPACDSADPLEDGQVDDDLLFLALAWTERLLVQRVPHAGSQREDEENDQHHQPHPGGETLEQLETILEGHAEVVAIRVAFLQLAPLNGSVAGVQRSAELLFKPGHSCVAGVDENLVSRLLLLLLVRLL